MEKQQQDNQTKVHSDKGTHDHFSGIISTNSALRISGFGSIYLTKIRFN